jgi:hypothetical protein
MPIYRGFMAFFNEKTMKTHKAKWHSHLASATGR